jgi:hypothetical protein
MAPPPELVAALQGTGLVGFTTDFELVVTLFTELLCLGRRRRCKFLDKLGIVGQRYLLDSLDDSSEEIQYALSVETWLRVTRRLSVATAIKRFPDAPAKGLFEFAWAFTALDIRRCLLDDQLQFRMEQEWDFCSDCQKTIKSVGLSIHEVREKIKSGQKIS